VPELSPSSCQTLTRIAVIGALVASLGLAGCGRKGGLDPPPGASASIAEPTVAGAQPGPLPGGQEIVGPDGRAAAPAQGPQRSTPIDWLLN
jgi:predicted small lipoprotein YifL